MKTLIIILFISLLSLHSGEEKFQSNSLNSTSEIKNFDTPETVEKRKLMVQTQIIARGIKDPKVIDAMLSVPRHIFVPSKYAELAYGDHPVPIGYSQTISQPYIVAYMTEAIDIDSTSKVLEVGTGSGYQAAVLAEIVDTVYTIEIIEELGKSAAIKLEEIGYSNIITKIGDGYHGWKEYAPFDGIVVTAAAENIPPDLVEQLKDGGKMIIPVGSQYSIQTLVLIEKVNGKAKSKKLMPVRFVPLIEED